MSDPVSPNPFLVADRVEPAVYVARNERGAEVRIGLPGDSGTFTPGELLRLAAAGCAALSADHALASRLGDDFDASIKVESVKNEPENRYEQISSSFEIDWSELDPALLAELISKAERAIDRHCTVGHTLAHGAPSLVEIKSK